LETRQFAIEDPKRFLAQFKDGAVIDEVQRVPKLFSWLQGWVDERQLMGDLVLTGPF
jgi:predicted AAA+ superfamily ATPase